MASKIKKKLGGNLRFMISGGAPLNAAISQFFNALGIPLIEGYGLTEAAPILCCNLLDDQKIGSVGKALPSITLKKDAEGVLWAKGPNIMSAYYNQTEATAEVIKDGWLNTGDVVTIDGDGFVTIVDRKKSLLVLSNGKNVAPLPLEEAVKQCPFVSQVVVIGDNEKFVAALIVPDFDALCTRFPKVAMADQRTLFCESEEGNRFFHDEIQSLMVAFSSFEQVKKIALLPKEWTIESDELTPTLKPKRGVILKNNEKKLLMIYGKKEYTSD